MPISWDAFLTRYGPMARALASQLVRPPTRQPARLPALEPARAITFLPARRSGTEERILPGNGPWSVTVILPLGAPEGVYRLRVERHDGAPLPEMAVSIPAEPEGRLTVLIRSLPGPGAYRLVLQPPDDRAPRGAAYEYPLRLAPPGVAPPH